MSLSSLITPRKIGLLALIMALTGTIPEVIHLWGSINFENIPIGFLMRFFSYISLDLFQGRDLHFDGVNPFNLAFYLVLFLGGIIYFQSRYRDTRLLRFAFALICYFKAVYLLYSFYHLAWLLTSTPDDLYGAYGGPAVAIGAKELFVFLLQALLQAGWIYLTWRVLLPLHRQKTLAITEIPYDGFTTTTLVSASLWQRLFHFLVDFLLLILIFSPMWEMLARHQGIREGLNYLGSLSADRLVVVLVLAVFRVFYYVPFEKLLGATPAKLLSETRVVDEAGQQPGTRTILGRTFARFVPLESLSFLWNSRWHDQWTNTDVVRETRTGAPAGKYFYFLPFLLVAGAAIHFGQEAYAKYKWTREQDAIAERQAANLLYRLDRLSVHDYLELKHHRGYDEQKIFLKVEKVSRDSLQVARVALEMPNYSVASFAELDKAYRENRANLDRFRIAKQAVQKAIQTANEPMDEQKPLTVTDSPFLVAGIETHGQPSLGFGPTYLNSPTLLQLSFVNKGWAADVVSLKVLEGELKWETPLPQRIPDGQSRKEGVGFSLTGIMSTPQPAIRFEVTLQDTLGRRHRYEVAVDGENYSQRFMRRL